MYQFTDDCLTGIETIDVEHRQLFRLINEAFSLAEDETGLARNAKSILAKLAEYANVHFAHEEAYMEEISDPELPRQKKEHAAFAKKVAELQLQLTEGDEAAETFHEILSYLVRWLYAHILSSDMMIGMTKTEKKDPYAFTDAYRTGISFIDEEHAKLFDIIKETHDIIKADFIADKYDEIMRILAKLKEYTRIHFADEEAYMAEHNNPALEAQRMAHDAFIERLVQIDLTELDRIEENPQEYLLNLVNYLTDWLINHILKMDKKTISSF